MDEPGTCDMMEKQMMTKMSMKVSDSFPLPTWHDGEVNEPNLILIYDCFLNFDVFGFC